MKYRQLKVPEELHWEIKKLAAEKNTTVIKLIQEFLKNDKECTKTTTKKTNW